MAVPERPSEVLADDPLLLTPEEAARILRVGRTTMYALMKAGELHPVHIGRSCRLSRAELERYVSSLETPAAASPISPTSSRRTRRSSTNQRGPLDDIPNPSGAL